MRQRTQSRPPLPPAVPFPVIVTICGSMRFAEQMRAAAVEETLAGRIVILPHVDLSRDRPEWPEFVQDRYKADLDELHRRKIDMADEILVVCPGGYIGESTRAEIEYATRLRKLVRRSDLESSS